MILSLLSCLCARQQALIHFLQASSRDEVLEIERIRHLKAKLGFEDPIYNASNNNCFLGIATRQDSEEKYSKQALLCLRSGRVSRTRCKHEANTEKHVGAHPNSAR